MADEPTTRTDDRTGTRRDDDPSGDRAPTLRFAFAFDPMMRVAALPFGVAPDRAGVEVEDERFTAHFGPWTVSTPLANVAGAEVTGPYQVMKVVGGPHLSLRDRGLTFATTTRQGVCVRFVEPVTGLDPFGRIRHPGLTVTVAEPAALAELLTVAAERHAEAGGDEPIPLEEIEQAEHDDLLSLTAAELRARAKELGVPRTSSMRKDELIAALQPDESAS